jgi:hypothetical protein
VLHRNSMLPETRPLGIISATYLLRQSPDAADPALATVPDMPAGPYLVRRTVVSNRPEAGEYSEGGCQG